ncbi:MAG: hypothetical protein Q4G60_13080 [bacterium]|nr:hypothetical protein [bacterium]
MRDLYNKSALNRIASQDRLDKTIVLVSPVLWVSVVGAFLVIGGLMLWGFAGRLPTSVDTTGVYMNEDGTEAIYAQTDGFVTDIKVDKGAVLAEGDLVATLGTEEDVYQIQQLDTRISYVENMTFESELDVVTKDTEQLAQIKLNAKDSDKTLEETMASLDLKKEKLQAAEEDVKAKEETMLKYKEMYYSTLAITDQKNEVAYTEANSDYETHFNMYEQAKNTYISSKESYNTKKANFDANYAQFDPSLHTDEEKAAYEAALADVESARTTAEDYRIFMEQAGEKLTTANKTLEQVRTDYLEYLNGLSGTQAENVVASTEYSEALQNYTAAKNAFKTLNDEVDELELKAVMDEGESENSAENYELQFNNQKSATLMDLQTQRDNLLNKASMGSITASSPGEIYDIPIALGMAVSKGSVIANILSGDLNNDTAICYVELSDAKKIEEGMEAHIYPSTVNKQEYGHIVATVEYVNGYVESKENMMAQLGNESLVQEFEQKGPVIEVICRLKPDSTTASGYEWSSEKGKDVMLTQGTIVSATVITGSKRPVDLLIPYLKEKLEFNPKDAKTQ